MSPTGTISPPQRGREAADEIQLRSRWAEPAEAGSSRRDAALTTLRSGVAAPMDLRGIALIGENLREVDFARSDLTGADLSEADLSGSVLAHCQLRDATLFRATLDDAELLGADLTGANLTEASARRAGLGHTELRDATLFDAHLEGATLTSAVLAGADLRAAVLEGARLREADLTGASFARARLRGADLGKSDVNRSEFENADLRDCRLRGLANFETASWIGVDIRDVDFSGAYMVRRHIMDENYLFEFRTRSRTNHVFYTLWWLTSDCGRSAVRWLLWNLAIAMLFGIVYCFVDLDTGSHPTPLSPFYYSFVTLTTLGYGDVVPASATAQVIAVLEVLVGYVALGGLLSILANKLARRAE